jgi:hypothetical protein
MLSGRVASISISVLLCLAIISDARSQSWSHNPASFLEPNRFGIISEINDSYLWLEAGFGRDIIHTQVAFGLEGLIWSRLRSLSGFRFPVETADYFFGVYSTFDLFQAKHRIRLSHISAHLVDGADTVVGGSSSRFSREFISIERAINNEILGIEIFGAIGIKYVFHQVTDVESAFQIPVSLNVPVLRFGNVDTSHAQGMLFLTASADAGPSWPVFSGGITCRLGFSRSASLDIFARYNSGLSRAGIEGKREEQQAEIGVQVIPFEWFD